MRWSGIMRLGIRLPSDFLFDFQHSCFEVAITEGVAQIPAHAEKDDLGLIVTPLEEIGFDHRQTSEEDSASGQSTLIDTRQPFFATQPSDRAPAQCNLRCALANISSYRSPLP